MRGRAFASAILACFLTVSPLAHADDTTSPGTPDSAKARDAWTADADTIAGIRAIVANTPGTAGVFEVNNDGSIKHLQSGLLCPPKFPNVAFWHAQIFSSAANLGTDVGCDYGRNGKGAVAVSKLTIFATKAPDGMTLDQAFAQYRAEILKTYPDALSQGEALKVQNEDPNGSAKLPEIRSEEFSLSFKGQPFTSQVIVALRGGWVMEIRATYLGKGNQIDMDKDATVDDAVQAIGDRAMAAEAFTLAAPTIGK